MSDAGSPLSLLLFLKNNFIYLFLTVLDLCCCMDFSLVAVSGGYSLVAMWGLLVAVASLVVEQGLGHVGSGAVTPRLLSTSLVVGAQAELLRGMWGLPGPVIKPESPVLGGRFFTTEPPGKPIFSLTYSLIL